MDNEIGLSPLILVVEDVHETRDGIEKLLKVDGYRVMLARDELDAIESAQRQRPDLILVSLAGLPGEVLGSGRRIRESAAARDDGAAMIWRASACARCLQLHLRLNDGKLADAAGCGGIPQDRCSGQARRDL